MLRLPPRSISYPLDSKVYPLECCITYPPPTVSILISIYRVFRFHNWNSTIKIQPCRNHYWNSCRPASLDSDRSVISDLFTPHPPRNYYPPPLNPGVSIACQKAGQVVLHLLTRRLQPRRQEGAALAPLHSTNHHRAKDQANKIPSVGRAARGAVLNPRPGPGANPTLPPTHPKISFTKSNLLGQAQRQNFSSSHGTNSDRSVIPTRLNIYSIKDKK